jgi:hypothetical protein
MLKSRVKKNKTEKDNKRSFDYWVEIIVGIFVVTAIMFDFIFKSYLDSFQSITSDIIIVLLPLVVTILSITLSMPREPIYGIENTDFRKLRGDKTYNFFDMMILTILIVTVFSVVSILNFVITVWVLSIVSIVYSIIFLNQEIPILIRDDKKIKKVIRTNIHKNIQEITLEVLPNEVSMLIALQNLLLTEGIISAFKVLETGNRERNQVYLDKLLSLQNEYLFGYIDNHTLVLESLTSKYKNIEILQAIDIAIKNINDIIGLNDQLNVLEIYGDEEHFYHITRSLFSLHRILTELKFDKKFKNEFSGIIINMFMKIRFGRPSESTNKFLYKILNAMIINTVSKSELWFLEILRDSSFSDTFSVYGSDEYMTFISIYFYYLVKLENRVPEDFKKKIEDFSNQPSVGVNSNGESWAQIFKHKLNYMNPEEVNTILPKMLSIYECNSNSYTWYKPPFQGTRWSSINGDHTFSRELIMNWWIGFILTNSNLHAHAINNKKILQLPKLNKNNADIFAVELNKNWFEDDKLKTGSILPIAKFYGAKEKVESYMESSELVSSLKNFKNEQLKKQLINEIQEHQVTPDVLEKHKRVLAEGFKKAINEFSALDTSIDLTNEKQKYFGILFDTRWSEALVKSYAEKMPESLSRLIYDDFSENKPVKQIKNEIKEYDVDTLKQIVSFKPTARYAYIYDFNASDEKHKLIEEINKIPLGEKLWLPHDLFIRNKAIVVNFEYLENESFVRKLTLDEINIIVDRDYKLVNGLYKYIEGANGDKSILLSREELLKIVSDKFFYACIVYKYKSIFKTEDILYFDVIKDKS